MKTAAVKKSPTRFRPQVLSRHPSHRPLRTALELLPFRSVIRLGSSTELPATVARGGNRIELNTTQGVKNSANKRLMKECFTRANVATAQWWTARHSPEAGGVCFYDAAGNVAGIEEIAFPLVVKHIFGSRGTGNHLMNTQEDLIRWASGKDVAVLNTYIFEKFYNFNREYRMHVSRNGCFYTCRKVMKSDTPQDKRWFRNDSNSSWLIESNPSFDRPVNFNEIVRQCQLALNELGLDFAAFDVRIQSTVDNKGNRRENPEFIIIESNSAPSFGEGTLAQYSIEIPRLLQQKRN